MTVTVPPPDASRGSRLFLLIGAIFLVSRALLVIVPQPTSDVFIYAQYVFEYDRAVREGKSFYDVHAQVVEEEIKKARAAGNLTGSLEEYKQVEYPPLSLLFIHFPDLWLGKPPAGEVMPPYLTGESRDLPPYALR